MVTRLADGVWHLDLGFVNAALVDDAGTLTLVDAGTRGRIDRLREEVGETGHGIWDVERVLVTHYDVDHAGGLPVFDDRSVPIHAGDAAHVRRDERPPLSTQKGLSQRLMTVRTPAPANEVVAVEDGATIGGFTAYATPGHTPGHVVFVHEERSAALLGDAARVTDGEFAPVPWFLNADTADASKSLRELTRRTPAFDVAVTGHGPPVDTDASDRLRSDVAD